METSRSLTALDRLTLTAVLLLASGCGFRWPGPPDQFPVVTVTGKVTYRQQPLQGWITFVPQEGAVGDHEIVPIGSDGQYTAQAPIGKVRVEVWVPPKVVRQLDQRFQTPISQMLHQFRGVDSPIFTLAALPGPHRFDVDLAVELAKALRSPTASQP